MRDANVATTMAPLVGGHHRRRRWDGRVPRGGRPRRPVRPRRRPPAVLALRGCRPRPHHHDLRRDRYRPPHGWHVLPFATGHVGAAAPGAGDYIRSPFGHDGITQHCWTRGDVVAVRSTTPCGVTKCFGSSTGRSPQVKSVIPRLGPVNLFFTNGTHDN